MSLFLSFDIHVLEFSVHGVKLQEYRPSILFDTAVLSLIAFISYRYHVNIGATCEACLSLIDKTKGDLSHLTMKLRSKIVSAWLDGIHIFRQLQPIDSFYKIAYNFTIGLNMIIFIPWSKSKDLQNHR